MTYHAALNGLQPYLHESRHIHALNRVRGSGGRFLSKKKLQESDPTPSQCNVTDTIHSHVKNDASELESYQSGTGQSGASNTTCSDITSVSYSNVTFRQPERRFSGIATRLGGGMEINSRLICRGTQHHTSVVQWKYGRRPCNRSGNSSLASSLLLRTKCARRTLLCIWSLWGLLFFFFVYTSSGMSKWLERVLCLKPITGLHWLLNMANDASVFSSDYQIKDQTWGFDLASNHIYPNAGRFALWILK